MEPVILISDDSSGEDEGEIVISDSDDECTPVQVGESPVKVVPTELHRLVTSCR